MGELFKIFTLQQWVVILAAGFNALVIGWLLWHYFQSRFWIEAVTDANTGRVIGGDVMKAGAFALACVLIIAVTVAKLGYGREAGAEIDALIFALLGYSGVLQDIKRRGQQPPAPNFNVSDSKVSIGPNGSATQSSEQVLAGYNDGPGSVTGRTPTQPQSTE